MKYTYKIVIGDWSDDGHGKSDFFIFKSSHEEKDIIKAYKLACKKSKISLHGNSGILCCYEGDRISSQNQEKFTKIGIDCSDIGEDDEEGGRFCAPEDVALLFLRMVKTQLDSFEFKIINDEIKCINGFWSKTFNESLGYGVYS